MSSSKLIVDDSEDSLIAKELLAQRKENMYNTMQVNLKPIVGGSASNGTGSSRLLTPPTVFVPEGENVKSFDMEVRDYKSECVNW